MLNWVVRNRTVRLFKIMETNEWSLTELLAIYNNIWNHSTLLTYVFKSYMSDIYV